MLLCLHPVDILKQRPGSTSEAPERRAGCPGEGRGETGKAFFSEVEKTICGWKGSIYHEIYHKQVWWLTPVVPELPHEAGKAGRLLASKFLGSLQSV